MLGPVDNSRCAPTAASNTRALVAVCREMDVRYSITVRQRQSLRNLIEAIPEADWTPIPYWLDGAAAVAESSRPPSLKRWLVKCERMAAKGKVLGSGGGCDGEEIPCGAG